MKNPKLSILSISYNQEDYIRDALDGFIAQNTSFEIEVIIGDDCSTDKTASIIEEYAEKYPNVIKPILRKKNIGPWHNFLDVLNKSTGQYIAICEGDDYWTDPDKLQKQVDLLETDSSLALCFHPVKVIYEDDSADSYIYPAGHNKNKFTTGELLKENFIQTNSAVYRRQNYDGLADNIMPGDWYFHAYHAQFGKIGFINEVMAVYRRNPGGIWWNVNNDSDEIWKKYGISHLALFEAISKIYFDNSIYQRTIEGHTNNIFNKLTYLDRKNTSQLLAQALEKFPHFGQVYVNDLCNSIENLRSHADEQAKIIKHLNNHNQQLTTENNLLQSKISTKIARKIDRAIHKR